MLACLCSFALLGFNKPKKKTGKQTFHEISSKFADRPVTNATLTAVYTQAG